MKGFWNGFSRGMGVGGWLTNYKRFNVLPEERRMDITVGDLEHFESYITEWDVKNIAELGMDHIRLGFDQIVVEERPYEYRALTMNCLEHLVKWCRKYGLNVVLNLHKAIGNYCDIEEKVQLLEDEELQNRFIALWLELEKRFADYPEVAFELLNEVRNVDPEKWNTLYRRTVAALRRVNPTRYLVVGSISWNDCHYLQELEVLDDPNIVYTFHMYAPHEFTHQRGVLQWPNLYYNRDMPYPGDIRRYREFGMTLWGGDGGYPEYEIMDRKFVWDALTPAAEFQAAHPEALLWCGEFGTIRHAKLQWRENYMRDVIAFLKAHDIPYCVWNYLSTPNDGNRFSLVDDDTRQILSPELARIIRGEVE